MLSAMMTAAAVAVPGDVPLPTDRAIRIADIGNFLVPHSDPIQIGFFWLILLSGVGALIWAGLTANKEHWRARLKDIQGDYNSPQDLSDAVATRAEHLCEALPGILLIVGLLGTFIGLGVALDDAATVFKARSNPQVQVEQLAAVVQSLGTKFKVSTWGIIGFLVVRTVAAWAGWNGKRLKWSTAQMRSDTDAFRLKNEGLRSASEKRLRDDISTASRDISAGTYRLGGVLNPPLDAIKQNTHAAQAALSKFVDTHVESMEKIAGSAVDMGVASAGMSSAADQVGETAANLQAVVELLQDKLVTAIERMNDSFNKNLAEMSNKMEQSTGKISTTMDDLGKTVGKTMEGVESVIGELGEALTETGRVQSETIDDFKNASEALSQNAEKMHRPIQELNTKLVSQFATTAAIGNEIVAFGQSNIKVAKVNEELRALLLGLSERTELAEICKTGDMRRLEGEIAKGNDLLAELLLLARNGAVEPGDDDTINGTAP